MAQPPDHGPSGALNMTGMANALPRASSYRPGYPPGIQQQRPGPQTSSTPVLQHMPGQYAHHSTVPMAVHPYYQPPHSHAHPFYGGALPTHQPHPRLNVSYYPTHMVVNQHHPSHIGGGYYYPVPAAAFPPPHSIPSPVVQHQSFGTGAMMQFQHGENRQLDESNHLSGPKPSEATEGRPGAVRGPPRKPRQSGHAIWIGNLPPQTDLMSLVHHVAKEGPGLESLFLISKSNCAFANFKDEKTCAEAQKKIHDSRFQSVRLVSRLRKSTVEGATGMTAPTGPAASSGSQTPREAPAESVATTNTTKGITTPSTESNQKQTEEPDGSAQKDKEKFFILKSLTVEDLELSVKTGIWATQSHNEEALNSAYSSADNVYLVFSANKSGEYFGYARMTSPINDDPSAAIEFAPKSQATDDVDLPKAIPTEATEFAPKGRVIDDSARGTIFWEAEHEDSDSADDEAGSDVGSSKAGDQEDGNAKTWGKPFRLEWLSTTRLPFYRTRGLRNPWNSNREVKIARDGTELEPSAGRRLIGLFNRVHSPGLVPPKAQPGMTMVAGYPPMRPPY
ncbi:hypothetical protein SODALDRAFT_280695 [Sodiomyces alkalinus F11]|uniref:YTH domain-containing protein n=1 Tax=Sodiomyces alkalinus (strain CBS 110278 / VKM F-3762 / F11) TaxID=1314773 RepID=A0A3N2PR58_SODAK|nr:hypothetical protein SODALDRAFT_280695 [Sodiomyces alkalinus F11]ROT36975.1 hypothetical protein SODALDRAFT_280695 [Sodiomyces alkalinus F11]